MCVGAARSRKCEPVADLDPFHGLGAHERPGKPSVEPLLLGCVRAESGRNPTRPHLDDAAKRVPIGAGRVNRLPRSLFAPRASDLEHRALDRDPDGLEESLGHRPGRHDHRGVARRGSFECVPDVVVAVLHDAGEIGVPRPRERHRLLALPRRLAGRRPGAHAPRPVLVVAVRDEECERRTEGLPVTKAREHLDLVGLDLLTRTAAVPLLAAGEIALHRVPVELESCREPRHDGHECRPVRLARGRKLQRHPAILGHDLERPVSHIHRGPLGHVRGLTPDTAGTAAGRSSSPEGRGRRRCRGDLRRRP